MKNLLHFHRHFVLASFVFLIFAADNSVSAQTVSAAANRQLDFWQTFSPAGGRFRVDAPREMNALDVPTEISEPLNLKVYRAGLRAEAFTVAHVDYPVDEEIIDLLKKNWDELWARYGDNISKNAPKGAFLVSDKNITKGSVAGRDVVIESNAIVYHVQFFLVGKRFYAVEMQTPVMRNAPEALTKIYQAEADKFFNSFQILDNKPQTARAAAKKEKAKK